MKSEIFEALDWQLEFEEPEVRLQNRRKVEEWYYPLIKLYATQKSQSYAVGNISILQEKNSTENSQSFVNSSISIKQELNSIGYSQSQAIRGNFYFATLQNLTGAAICSSYGFGEETDVTSFVLLEGAAQSESYAGNSCIYYVNYQSAAISPAYSFKAGHSVTVYVTSATKSQSFGKVEVSEKYLKDVPYKSKALISSFSRADEIRGFNLYTTNIDNSYSLAQETTNKELNSKVYSSTQNSGNNRINKELFSEGLTQSFAKVNEQIKLNITSKVYTQTFLDGQEMLDRLLQSTTKSQSKPNITLNKEILITSKMIGASNANGGETITRVFNGVADSISVAQKSLGSISRLFVSGALSSSFSKSNGIPVTKFSYSALYSQTFIKSSDIVIDRPLQSKANSANPFHGQSSKLISRNAVASVATLSGSQETVDRPIASKANSANPFHANPNVLKDMQAATKAADFAKTNGINIKLNMASRATALTELTGAEIVDRPLIGSGLAIDFPQSSMQIEKDLTSSVIAQTKIASELTADRPINSEVVSATKLNSVPLVSKPLNSQAISPSKSLAENTQVKVNLSSQSKVESNANANEIISRELNSTGISPVKFSSDGFLTKINIYGSARLDSFANSQGLNKEIGLQSEMILQTYIGGTDNYLGDKQSNVEYAQPEISQDVINLAPFNYGTNNEL